MKIPREGFNTPVESIGTWASHADEDVLRPAPNKEGVELGGNDLATKQKMFEPQRAQRTRRLLFSL
jgi:hypothetical protein